MRLCGKDPNQGCGFTLSNTRLGQEKAHHQCASSPLEPSGSAEKWSKWLLRELEEMDRRE